ncbi:regulatory protein RecX [Ferruginibacter sp. HRS2-29]|uniref:regulatory protein RecX n=1 Tax=Ferruginibacter sp. HRS2-29 TaxID=2487334 RepID=UPI0020CDFC17|nr:regulatory protein RecX [Ferruginibacter sp. HRS2-29]MCP9749634.1 RecX family transcriptional regulator [Ferruginibacter sp. HRS2-29]
MRPLNIGTEKAFQKIKHYCAYQERSHYEVKEKLYSFGLYKNEVEELLSSLIEENYLNEERFAIAFAGGKFRMKQWGKVKINYELKQKGVSPYNIKKALQSIGEEDYEKAFRKLAGAKLETLRSEKNIFIKKKKVQQYLLQKGFETGMISGFLNGV